MQHAPIEEEPETDRKRERGKEAAVHPRTYRQLRCPQGRGCG